MTSNIRSILNAKGQEVVKVDQDTSVPDAVKAMVEHGIGSVLVVNKTGRPVGIFTERDVLRLLRNTGKELKAISVSTAMSRDLIIGFPDDSVSFSLDVMTRNKIRHLPILEKEEIVGIISIGDLVKSQMTDIKSENHYLRDYIMGKYPG